VAAKPEVARPTLREVEAAASVLYAEGRHHHWWPQSLPETYQQLDPIGRDEFEAIVERMLIAAKAARLESD
jgi:hypothetical protein